MITGLERLVVVVLLFTELLLSVNSQFILRLLAIFASLPLPKCLVFRPKHWWQWQV